MHEIDRAGADRAVKIARGCSGTRAGHGPSPPTAAGKAERYYETHLSLWGPRRLVRDFEVTDDSLRIVRDPERFHATEMVRLGSLKQTVSLALLKAAYRLCPTYIWILRKRDAS